jgi:tetratricopeptide (TPR) repeat protein
MKKSAAFALALWAIASIALAQNPTTLEQAKALSGQRHKPILLEFFQPDCDICQLASRDIASNDTIKTALKSVVYLPLDVNSTEGDSLSKLYYVENTFPVFVLADSAADIIYYWQGYSQAGSFIGSLNAGLAAPITIKTRYKKLESSPSISNVLYLAKFNSDVGENLKAAELYQRAQTMLNSSDYLYKIFENYADAVWKGKSTFDELVQASDNVLAASPGSVNTVANVGIIIARVARKVGRTNDIAKYLQAGVAITDSPKDPRAGQWHSTLLADQTLYVKKDTIGAINIKKQALGPDWEKKPGKIYGFAQWCLERKINLVQAENYAKQAVEQTPDGKQKGQILTTLADIYEARGKLPDAISTIQLAAKQDPHNNWYKTKLDELRAEQSGKK